MTSVLFSCEYKTEELTPAVSCQWHTLQDCQYFIIMWHHSTMPWTQRTPRSEIKNLHAFSNLALSVGQELLVSHSQQLYPKEGVQITLSTGVSEPLTQCGHCGENKNPYCWSLKPQTWLSNPHQSQLTQLSHLTIL